MKQIVVPAIAARICGLVDFTCRITRPTWGPQDLQRLHDAVAHLAVFGVLQADLSQIGILPPKARALPVSDAGIVLDFHPYGFKTLNAAAAIEVTQIALDQHWQVVGQPPVICAYRSVDANILQVVFAQVLRLSVFRIVDDDAVSIGQVSLLRWCFISITVADIACNQHTPMLLARISSIVNGLVD